jgi:O-antigen ligase
VSQALPFRRFDFKFLRYVDVIAAIVAICIVGRLAWQEDLSWIGAIVVCVLVVSLTAVRWPFGALVVLIVTGAMPVFSVEIAGWNARPEHFGVAIVAVAVLVWMIRTKTRWRLDKVDYWILAFVLVNFVSSAFASSDPSLTIRWAFQNCLAITGYFLVRSMVADLATLQKASVIFLVVGVLESIYGILCYVSNLAFGTTVGVQLGQYLGDVAAPFGTLFEANLFGAYTASCAVFFFAFYLFKGQRFVYLLGFLISTIGVVVSFSRAALAALVFAVGYLFWKSIRRREAKDVKKLLAIAATLVVILILFSGTVGRIITQRFTNLFDQGLAEETTISRFIVAQEALQDIPGHFLLGRGTASFNLTFDWSKYVSYWAGEKTWIGNAPLRIMHDTGAIGLITILGFFVTIAKKVRYVWKNSKVPSAILVGLWAASLVYVISFETTDGTILAFCWIQLGLLASAAVVFEQMTRTCDQESLQYQNEGSLS